MLPRLERRHAVTHLHLDRLSTLEVGSFLAAVYGREPSYRVIEALHARTGGNPFFLEELLAAARQDDPDELMSQELPWSLAELVRAQLDDLTAEQRRVLETAAVLGVTRVGFDVLAAVSGYAEDELIPILRHLVARGLLVEAEADVFSFRHALAREAIESDLLGRERRRLHQAALDALRDADSDDFAAIAHHAHGAGQFDDMVAAARKGARALAALRIDLSGAPARRARPERGRDDPELLDIASRAAWLERSAPRRARPRRRGASSGAARRGDLEAESAALRLICRLDHDLGDAVGDRARAPRRSRSSSSGSTKGSSRARRSRCSPRCTCCATTSTARSALGRPGGRARGPARPARGAGAGADRAGSAFMNEPDAGRGGRGAPRDVDRRGRRAGPVGDRRARA